MHIKSEIKFGIKKVIFNYYDSDDFSGIDRDKVSQAYGVCFLGEQVILVTYDEDKPNFPGGTVEPGENFEEAFLREIEEETNCKVLSHLPIGYQVVDELDREKHVQVRYVAKVKRIGDFVVDPGGTVKGNIAVSPQEVNGLTGYGKIGERMIERALEIKHRLDAS